MRVLALVHGAGERSETFGDVVREHGHELLEWDLPERGRPSVDADAVMLFGGAPNVGEEDRYPWLDDEYELLRAWVDAGTPVLGVCLGAQTLAHTAGGRVAATPEAQVGFREVALTAEGKRDPVLGVLPETFTALFSNSYAFDVPPGAVAVATSPGRTQAFRLGERAWGLQFHPEVRREQVLHWWGRRSWLPKPLEELERELDENLAGIQRDGRAICAAFLEFAT
jgi:GMP synthase-like glutamine amidotransferase